MAGRFKLDIKETEAELKNLLGRQTTAQGKERVQALYLLKGKRVKTVSKLASLLGRHRVTVQDWLSLYREGGIQALLEHKKPTGRKPSIPPWAVRALKERLRDPQSFESYGAVQKWLQDQGVDASYAAVYRLLRKLKAKLKAAKRRRNQASQKLKQFAAYLGDRLVPWQPLLDVEQFRQTIRELLGNLAIKTVVCLIGWNCTLAALSIARFSQKNQYFGLEFVKR